MNPLESVAFKPFFTIGQIVKALGVRGELVIEIEDAFLADIRHKRFLWLVQDGCHIPYQIEALEQLDDTRIKIKLSDVHTPEAAKQLTGLTVFLPEKDVSKAIQTNQHQAFIGYFIHDIESGRKIEIERFEEYPGQTMVVGIMDGQSVMIPFHEAFINEILEDQHRIVMKLPEGLFDL